MLNFVTYDISDQKLLERSFNAIKNKENLTIVQEESEKLRIFRQTINSLKIPSDCQFSFQNLVKISLKNGSFYIAQCLLDYGYPIGSKGSQTFTHKYYYGAIGIATLTVNLGLTDLRPETKVDKFWNRLFNADINFKDSEKFSEKYYLKSNNREAVIKYFDKSFLNTIGKYNNVLMSIKDEQMYISFENELENNQCRIIEQIFENFKFIAL
jgi:hypothetical protein